MSAPVSNSGAAQSQGQAAAGGSTSSGARGSEDDYSQPDQVKIFSHEGDGENTEHLNSMDLHDIKTELERDAETAETPKSAAETGTSSFNADSIVTTSSGLPQASIRPVIHHPTAMVYANGGAAVPFMIPPFAAAAATAGSPLYPVMRPVKVESDWKGSQSGTGQLSIPTYSYPAGFLPVDQNGLRPAYPFMAIPSQYVTTQMPYQAQFTALGQSVAPNAAVQPNSGGMIAPQVKEKKPHIKKPLNAFMLFMKQKRADVIKECTLKESAAINQILGKMWHALDRSEQAKYYEMAREERAKHMQMYPGWSARDNYAVHKKRRKRKVKQVDSKAEDALEERNKEGPDKDPAMSKLPQALAQPTAPSLSKGSLSPTKTPPPGNQQRIEEDDIDNIRKCRARFGLEQQHMWCSPCRRKKKCIRYSVDDDEHGPKDTTSEVEDEVLIPTAGMTQASVMLSEPTEEDNQQQCRTKDLPHHMLRHDVPVTLQTIPT